MFTSIFFLSFYFWQNWNWVRYNKNFNKINTRPVNFSRRQTGGFWIFLDLKKPGDSVKNLKILERHFYRSINSKSTLNKAFYPKFLA